MMIFFSFVMFSGLTAKDIVALLITEEKHDSELSVKFDSLTL